MRKIVESYKDFIIWEATYYDDYGAWFQFCPYAFAHKDIDEDPEGLSCTYGWAKTIEDCKNEIENRIDIL